MKNNFDIVEPGSLFILDRRPEIESHISVLFPHWQGGNVIVTDVRKSKLFRHDGRHDSVGTITLVEFLFCDRLYSESINDFLKRAKCLN